MLQLRYSSEKYRYDPLANSSNSSSPVDPTMPSHMHQIASSILHNFRRRARLLILCVTLPSLGGAYWVSTQSSLSSSASSYRGTSDVYGHQRTQVQHPSHFIFEHTPSTSNDSSNDTRFDPLTSPLMPTRRLPSHCIDAHFSAGEPCFDDRNDTTFDVLWTWVNGSDTLFFDEFDKAAEEVERAKLISEIPRARNRQYRDHDELRHSLRSVVKHFRPHVNRFHILTSDFPYDPHSSTSASSNSSVSIPTSNDTLSNSTITISSNTTSTSNSTSRIGQLPSWLNPSDQGQWKDGNISLVPQWQSQVFPDFKGTSFNSYGIESQFPWLKNGISDNFLYLNDDFFFTADLKPSDFYSHSYGPVLRLMTATAPVIAKQNDTKAAPTGEWGPLGYTSYLIEKRFGVRAGRPYGTHVPKMLSMPHIQEIAKIWYKDLARTGEHRFRGMGSQEGQGGRDMYLVWMFSHFLVERWREALLWTWVVGHVGGTGDEWGEFEKLFAWTEVGGNPEKVGVNVNVALGMRDTMEEGRVKERLEKEGTPLSGKTGYAFSSADGYPYSYITVWKKRDVPRFKQNLAQQPLCRLSYNTCFGSARSASEAFKLIAFEKPEECGDCIIHALRGASGTLGLSAFIPPPSKILHPEPTTPSLPSSSSDSNSTSVSAFSPPRRKRTSAATPKLTPVEARETQVFGEWYGGAQPPSDFEDVIPHLPLVTDWREGKFALKDVVKSSDGGPVNIRGWALRLLERYRFVIGETPFSFIMIHSEMQARRELAQVDMKKSISLLCLNDDVDRRPALADRVMRTWLGRRFLKPAAWER